MRARHLIVISLVLLVLFAASVPVYASHTVRKEPSEAESRLFEEIFSRVEKHRDLIEPGIDDVKKSLSEPLKVFFSCRYLDDRNVESVTIRLSTELAGFDEGLATKHKDVLLGAAYVWDCTAIKDRYTLTIECTNKLMLNPDFVTREETETGEKRIVAMAENEMTLYHELLHGQLMINAMQDTGDASGWRADACRFFERNNNEIDYTPSDRGHMVIPPAEDRFLSRLMEKNNGLLIVKTIGRDVGTEKFTQVMASQEELGGLVNVGYYVFARSANIEDTEIVVSDDRKMIQVSGSLQDPTKDGLVRMFILPRLEHAGAKIELSVDDAVKSAGSAFVFSARVQNLQPTDITGSLTLFVDGVSAASSRINLSKGEITTMDFVWKNNDEQPAMHSVLIDGLGSVSNQVTVMTFERFVSASAIGHGTIVEQLVFDTLTGSEVVLARPERISATVAVDDREGYDVRLFAPDGTLVVGMDGKVSSKSERASLVEVGNQNLVVKFKNLSDRLVFLAVKSTGGDSLPAGDWTVKTVDASGHDLDSKIKYRVSYVRSDVSIR